MFGVVNLCIRYARSAIMMAVFCRNGRLYDAARICARNSHRHMPKLSDKQMTSFRSCWGPIGRDASHTYATPAHRQRASSSLIAHVFNLDQEFHSDLRDMPEFRSYAEVAAAKDSASHDDDTPHRLQQEGLNLVGRAIDDYPPGKPYSVAIEEAPITYERLPYVPSEGDPLLDPGTVRATSAPSKERPHGSTEWSKRHQDKTVSAESMFI